MVYIKEKGTPLYVATHIDGGGMSAWLTRDIAEADTFADIAAAKSFITRLKERYPESEFEVWSRP